MEDTAEAVSVAVDLAEGAASEAEVLPEAADPAEGSNAPVAAMNIKKEEGPNFNPGPLLFISGYNGGIGNFDAAHDDGGCFFYRTFGHIDDDATQFVVQFIGVFQLSPDAVHVRINGFR